MRKTLIATSALAFAGAMGVGQASAADMLGVGVGGYMEQWIGAANRDDDGVDGGFDMQSDSEVYVSGSLETDMGLKFGVRVQFEANGDVTVDESNAWVSGAFGHIDMGARDPIYTRMHYAAAFGAGVGLNAGDTQNWIGGSYLETAGWTVSGDDFTLSYTTPRMNGVQVGVSYTPDTTNENAPGGQPLNNDNAAMGAAINFVETVGDMSVAVSLGHINVSNPGMLAYNAENDGAADDDMVQGFDDRTYTNAGLSVGMGAFTFTASYATRDDGGYVAECWNVDNEVKTLNACGALPPDAAHSEVNEATGVYPGVDSDGSGSIDGTEVVTNILAIEDGSLQHDTWAIGIGYSDGPVSVSIGHISRESENGEERTATMVSAGYRLAPGIDWKTSIFGVEDTTSHKDVTGGVNEGTAFVTGLDIHF